MFGHFKINRAIAMRYDQLGKSVLGVLAESGIPTFRSQPGVTCRDIDERVSPEKLQRRRRLQPTGALRADPAPVHRFYDRRGAALTTVVPNAAHVALARLGRERAGGLLIVTRSRRPARTGGRGRSNDSRLGRRGCWSGMGRRDTRPA